MIQKFLQALGAGANRKLVYWVIAASGIVVLLLILALSGGSAWQIDDDASSVPSTAGMIWDVLIKLVLVIALIYAVVFLLRSMQEKQMVAGKKRKMFIEETLRLSPKQSIHLIAIGNRGLLVGSTDQAMNLIAEIELAEEQDIDTQSIDLPQKGFESIFQKVLGKSVNTVGSDKVGIQTREEE